MPNYYKPDVQNLERDLPGVVVRNLNDIARLLNELSRSGLGGRPSPLSVGRVPLPSGNTGQVGLADAVLTKHLNTKWTIEETVAITRVIFDSPEAEIIFKDEDTILIEIEG